MAVCEICGYNHTFARCPFTFFIPNKYKIIMTDRNLVHTERGQCKRRNRFKDYEMQALAKLALAVSLDYGYLEEKDINME